MLGPPASEKRRGTKSREVGAPSVPRALWGFSRGVRLGRLDQSASADRFACQSRSLSAVHLLQQPHTVWMSSSLASLLIHRDAALAGRFYLSSQTSSIRQPL